MQGFLDTLTENKEPMIEVTAGFPEVTIQYLQWADGSVEPQKLQTVVVSTQHAKPPKPMHRKEVAGYINPNAAAPSMEETSKLLVEAVAEKTMVEITLRNLYDDFTQVHINSSGKFLTGGPEGMFILDVYGRWDAHESGAFSGKHATKAGTSVAYIYPQTTKSVVKSGLCKCALVQQP